MRIKAWPEDERPREKLFRRGEQSLSDGELLAILIRSGCHDQSALDVARAILTKFKTFRNMSETDPRDWREFKGIGPAKLAQIRAALEIARRFTQREPGPNRRLVKVTEEVAAIYMPQLRDLKNERMLAVCLDSRNGIIASAEIDRGTPGSAQPRIREIISRAMQQFAVKVICLHNHPAGDPAPSREDESFTEELRQGCKLMGLSLLDHIIFGDRAYYSFDKREVLGYPTPC